MGLGVLGDNYSDKINRWSKRKSELFDQLKADLASIDESKHDALQQEFSTWEEFFDQLIDEAERQQKLYEVEMARALVWCAHQARESKQAGPGLNARLAN